jgi:imidazolonepropionase
LGALALLSPYPAAAEWLTRMPGCVHVIQAIGEFDSDAASPQAFRKSLDNGWPAAISGGAAPGHAVANPQYLLHMAATRFGMAAEEAIMATTWNASCSLRMSHVTGSLEPGKAADLLIMDVPDYRELARRPGESDVYMSLSAGRVVYRRGGLILD